MEDRRDAGAELTARGHRPTTMSMRVRWPGLLAAAAVLLALPLDAQTERSGDEIRITRLTEPIVIDGRLGDRAWESASRVTTWYETDPGDNTPPDVKSVGYLGFDSRAFYAGFEFDDPNARAIRSPLGDHDHIGGNTTDYGGVILDTRNDGHSAVLLLASPTGVQYDAVTDDQGGNEDSAPDFFWEAAARINDHGWTLEIRVPFSSLRYRSVDPQTWGILLFRNYPRDFRHSIFSARVPRGSNCFICRANTLVGLEQLPSSGHVVAAPYLSMTDGRTASGGPGSPLTRLGADANVGVDVKWTPNADHAVDATFQPDFSQVESDTAQISANERFALSFPEKRPFFLEGVQLFSTPLKAVYTRTITSPKWGARATGKAGRFDYTFLATEDQGGGSTVVPGRLGSVAALQPSSSMVMIARVRQTFGRNFLGALVTDRESHDGQGFNRVVGPDFLWRPTGSDIVSGQWLFTSSREPRRPDLLADWDGQHLSGGGASLAWNHNTTHLDTTAGFKALSDEFRTDTGFIPQVGYRSANAGGGWTVRPSGMVRRVRSFANIERQADRRGDLLQQIGEVGSAINTTLGGFIQLRYLDDRLLAGSKVFPRRRLGYLFRFNPSRRLTQIQMDGNLGGEVDFANARPADGSTINVGATIVPTDRLEIALVANRRQLQVSPEGSRERLFVASVARVRSTWSFNAHSFVRAIAQYVGTTREPRLYQSVVTRQSGVFSGSALFAYKINWQSVLFVGYGDDRQSDDEHGLRPVGQQLFVKMSYAFQR
jgi:hypothetical protein